LKTTDYGNFKIARHFCGKQDVRKGDTIAKRFGQSGISLQEREQVTACPACPIGPTETNLAVWVCTLSGVIDTFFTVIDMLIDNSTTKK